MTQLRGLPVILPPITEQNSFARRFESCRMLEVDQDRAATLAAESFRALLARVFGGRA
jgi:hypothetical protein